VSKKTPLHFFLIRDNLVPHEPYAINLMCLDTTSNLVTDMDEALIFELRLVDDDLVLTTRIARHSELALEFLPTLLQFPYSLTVLIPEIAGFGVLENWFLAFLVRRVLIRIIVITCTAKVSV
jgi:hypothetical protein